MTRPMPLKTIALLAFAGAATLSPPVWAGDGEAKAPPAAEKAPSDDKAKAPAGNPLDAPDPFVGEFSNEQMLVVVRLSVDGYVGEIRRGGKTYPMKAAGGDGKLTGVFTVDQASYPFTAVLDGATLKLTTGTTSYPLIRKGAAGDQTVPTPAPPVPTPPTPTPAPALPTPPTPTPAPVLPTPPIPTPPVPAPPTPIPTPTPTPTPSQLPEPVPVKPVLTGPLPQHQGYAQLPTLKLRDLAWARFPVGAFAVFGESASSSTTLPKESRRKIAFEGVVEGKVKLRNYDWDGSKFDRTGMTLVLPDGDLFRISELGLDKGAASADDLTVQGVVLRCERTPFTGELTTNGVKTRVAAEVWRSSEVDVPPLSIDLPPDKKLILDADIVRLKLTCVYRGVTGVTDLRLDSISRETKVGDRTVHFSVVKSITTFDRPDGRIETHAEWWLSGQIPGGILKTSQVEQAGSRVKASTGTVVEFSNSPKR